MAVSPAVRPLTIDRRGEVGPVVKGDRRRFAIAAKERTASTALVVRGVSAFRTKKIGLPCCSTASRTVPAARRSYGLGRMGA